MDENNHAFLTGESTTQPVMIIMILEANFLGTFGYENFAKDITLRRMGSQRRDSIYGKCTIVTEKCKY